MAISTKLSEYATRLDVLLQGINVSEISAADRKLAIRDGVSEYNQKLPKISVAELAGDGGKYYLLHGKVIDIDETTRDASIAIDESGTDQKLGILFTTSYEYDLKQVNVWMSRVGSTVAGTISARLYTVSNSLAVTEIGNSDSVEIDDTNGIPIGIFRKAEFIFDPEFRLPAGTYCVVLETDSYTFASGTNELQLGVDQSSVTNSVVTYDGANWTAYGTDSAGIMEIIVGLPGWALYEGTIKKVEYPAATIASDEQPRELEKSDYRIMEAAQATFLYFPNLAPVATEKIRFEMSAHYHWVELTDPIIDIPPSHFEAMCSLSAAVSCDWLAARYGQNRASSIAADSVNQTTKSQEYRAMATRFRKRFESLTNTGKSEVLGSMVIADIDLNPSRGGDFLFHSRRTR